MFLILFLTQNIVKYLLQNINFLQTFAVGHELHVNWVLILIFWCDIVNFKLLVLEHQ
jgi:hypothetical protein